MAKSLNIILTEKNEVNLSLSLYLGAGLLMLIVTRGLIPWISQGYGYDPIYIWFTAGAALVFLPLLAAAWLILKKEGFPEKGKLPERLRFRKITGRDLMYTSVGFAASAALALLAASVIKAVEGDVSFNPGFMKQGISSNPVLVIILWLPFWVLNIMSEEILWRGALLPRTEKTMGRLAWLFHGMGWTLFHIAFGVRLLIILLPLLFILPWAVQKTKNSWTGVIMHGALNGPSFILVATGIIG